MIDFINLLIDETNVGYILYNPLKCWYNLYGLTEEERKIVEEGVSPSRTTPNLPINNRDRL